MGKEQLTILPSRLSLFCGHENWIDCDSPIYFTSRDNKPIPVKSLNKLEKELIGLIFL